MKDSNIFVDSNIWIYLYSTDIKSSIAKKIIDQHFESIILSSQVIGEISHALTRKGITSKEQAQTITGDLMKAFKIADVTAAAARRAIEINIRFSFSYWDSLIIASALEHDCSTLYTEDLHHGQMIEKKLTIINPFA